MRKVLVSYEITVAQSKDHPLIVATPDYVFSVEYDKDDNESFKAYCDLEYKVEQLVRSLKALGCQVACICREVSHLNFD